jgi:hypothetical protein
LGAKNLWLDETLSWRLVQFPLEDLVERTGERATANPPFYFIMLGRWQALWGDSESALRSLSVLFGLVAIAGVYALVRALRRLSPNGADPAAEALTARGPALLAAALVALSPLAVYASQQARSYSFGTALFVWSSWALVRALTAPDSGKWFWAMYGSLSLVFCYTHYLALFLIASQALFAAGFLFANWRRGRAEASGPGEDPAAGQPRPRVGPVMRAVWLCAVFVVLALGFLPWMSRLQGQTERLTKYSWHLPLSVDQVPEGVGTAMWATVAVHEPLSPMLTWLTTLALCWLFLHLALHGGWPGRLLVTLSLAPVVFYIAWSLWSDRSLIHPRYLAFVQPLWLTCVAVVCGLLPRLALIPAAGVLLAVQAAACVWNWGEIGPTSAPGMREAMARVEAWRAPQEPIVVENPFLLCPALYYAHGQMRPRVATTTPTRRMMPHAAQLKQEDLIDPHELVTSDPPGIWCISCQGYGGREGVWFALPEGWRQERVQVFQQDNPWEAPIFVEHWVPDHPHGIGGP